MWITKMGRVIQTRLINNLLLLLLLLLLQLALQPLVGFGLLYNFVLQSSIFTLLSPISHFRLLYIFFYLFEPSQSLSSYWSWWTGFPYILLLWGFIYIVYLKSKSNYMFRPFHLGHHQVERMSCWMELYNMQY